MAVEIFPSKEAPCVDFQNNLSEPKVDVRKVDAALELLTSRTRKSLYISRSWRCDSVMVHKNESGLLQDSKKNDSLRLSL